MEFTKSQTVYWTSFDDERCPVALAATVEGLCFVGSREQFAQWSKARFKKGRLENNDRIMKPYSDQFEEYLQGKRTEFTIPVDVQGTSFQRSIWNALCEIPYGRTRSYCEIAERIGKPRSVRAVGAAIGANPVLIVVPCHRVIGKNSKLTGYRGGLEMKAELLRLESGAPIADTLALSLGHS